ncbi:glycosyltransferase family protein [Flavobacterium silvaticum]|uniref:Uncharacterized protein n=1 Tax=Flavobacterium silvaticum TaxID=1852020 RepID=A0A972FVF0_9FLAO|nr:hypothetical protein [Flavobacterium silvaticum]NMH28747.1 hypothetical protein [Flavobacterium silvaticum]
MKRIHLVLLSHTIVFTALGIFAFIPEYIEGDDASSILYHLCGRNADIQRPYAAYHSGFDFLLGFLGNDEAQLRQFSIGLSFMSGYAVVCLLTLFLDLLVRGNDRSKYLFLALIPFIVPDVLFHSLIFNPSNVSFSFALCGLLFYIKYLRSQKISFFIVSFLFLGLAIPFRWSMLTIFPVFFAVALHERTMNLKTFITTGVHLFLALFTGILLIWITGYPPVKVVETMLWGTKVVDKTDASSLSVIATGSAFFTPQLIMLALFGLWVMFRKKAAALTDFYIILLAICPFFILGFFTAYKFLLSAVPILLLVCLYGFMSMANRRIPFVLLTVTIIGTWFIGIQIEADGVVSGPGFCQHTNQHNERLATHEKNPDKRIRIKKVMPVPDGGFYMPMLEGPRPLYGYFYVLFGGQWKEFVSNFRKERIAMYKVLTAKNALYFQDRPAAFFQCDLYRSGYHTDTDFIKASPLDFRVFTKSNHEKITLFTTPAGKPTNEFDSEYIGKSSNIIFRSTYSSQILKLTQDYPEIRVIGPHTIYKP